MKGDMLSGVIVVIIVVGSSVLVLNQINPLIDESEQLQRFNEARQTLHFLDNAITQLIYEAPGARRSIDLNVREGKLEVVGSEDKIRIMIENIDLLSTGTSTQEGNIVMVSGGTMRAYERDIDGD